MKTKSRRFLMSTIAKICRNVWVISVLCCFMAFVSFVQPAYCAGISRIITNDNGDIVTVQLTGAGSMSVTLVNTNQGPVNQVLLQNTDGTSALTIKVKKSATGNGVVNVNSIVGNGSLKSLSAKQANIVGSGISFGGSVGKVTIGNLADSAVAITGSGVGAGGLALGSLSCGVISNSQIQVNGSVGKVSASQMTDSLLWVGFTPSISMNPMAGGTFGTSNKIISVSLKGVKGSTAAAFVNSTIAAQSIGTLALGSVTTNNSGVVFGVLTDTGIRSASVKLPKFKWNANGRITQGLGDFQVRRLAEVIVTAQTRVLTAADLVGSTLTSNQCVFSNTAPSLQGVQPGDVLVCGVGNGFLLKVLSVTPQGGTLVLQTVLATLTDVIAKGAFDQKATFVPSQLIYLAPGVTVSTNNPATLRPSTAMAAGPMAAHGQFTFAYNFDNVALAPNVTLSGSADLTVAPDVSVQIGFPFDLQAFSASVTADMNADLDLFIGASLSAEKEILLAQYAGTPFVIMAGPVPIVIVPMLELYGGASVQADAGIEFGADITGSYTAGAAWQKGTGWNNLGANSLSFSTTLGQPSVGGNMRAYLQPHVKLAFYGVSGPDISAEPGVTLAGNLNVPKKQFCWSLTGDVDAGIRIEFLTIGNFDLSYQADLFSYTHQFAGTCYSVSSGSAPTVTTGAASSITSVSATLNGTANPNGLPTMAHFEWGTTASYGNSTSAQSLGSGTSSASVNAAISGLSPNTTYHFRLVASNSAGTTQGSDRTFTTTSNPTPPTVTTLVASAVGTTTATLNGSVNPHGLTTTDHFEWGLTTSYGNTTPNQSAGSGTGTVSMNAGISGLAPGTTYHFRAIGSNSAGTAYGADLTFTTGSSGGAPTVTTGAATSVTTNSATLNGTVNANGLATTVWFEWGTTTNYGNATVAQAVGSSTSTVAINTGLTGLSTNTTYHFRAVAANGEGTSAGEDHSFTTSIGVIGVWTRTGTMTHGGRQWHVATLLGNGKVLVAGGMVQSSVLSSAELYDPATGIWAGTGALNTARDVPTSILLPNGQVLVAGGYGVGVALSGAELYDPGSGNWIVTGMMNSARAGHTATLLANGLVLVAGGYNGAWLSSAELYNPTTGQWTSSGSLNTTRDYHTATLLPSGKVLVAGGYDNNPNGTLSSAELFDPATGIWTTTGSLNQARGNHTATLLSNGKVLVAGGSNQTNSLASAELYDPATEQWTMTSIMSYARVYHTATLLSDGKVLVAGGPGYNPGSSSELYDPSSETWSMTGGLNTPRSTHTATLLPNGQVLAAGGVDNTGFVLSGSEIFHWMGLSGGVAAVAGGWEHTIALKSDGTVWTWGDNNNGELGDGTTTDRHTPAQVGGLTGVVAVAGEARSTTALKSDGTVWAWGLNEFGELGNGTTIDWHTPVQVGGWLTNIVAIAGGVEHTIALKSDGTVWTWGENGQGELGDGTRTNRYTPVQVVGLRDVIGIAGGGQFTAALKSDGTVWTWGDNGYGTLGDGTGVTRFTPVQVAGLTGVIAIACGEYHMLALKSDGTVWAWGQNHEGQLGDGTTMNRWAPVQVVGLTSVIGIAGGVVHTIALKSDGTVWTWGDNGYGQLGDGTTTTRYTPVQVGGLTGVIAVGSGGWDTIALKPGGTVWIWGYNDSGQLGDGTTTDRHIPVQVTFP